MRCCIRIGQRSAFMSASPRTASGAMRATRLPGQGDTDLEVRVFWPGPPGSGAMSMASPSCRSPVSSARAWRMKPGRFHGGVGAHAPWLLMVQAYARQAQSEPIRSRWRKREVSITRDLGCGRRPDWRQTLSGRRRPSTMAPVLAVWRPVLIFQRCNIWSSVCHWTVRADG